MVRAIAPGRLSVCRFDQHPFFRAPTLPLNTATHSAAVGTDVDIDKDLAALPRPRKHYATYCASREANEDMWHAPQGIHALLREQFYSKAPTGKGTSRSR